MKNNNPYRNDFIALIIKRGIQLFLVILITSIVTEILLCAITFSDETTYQIRRYAVIFMMLVFWVLVGKDRFKKTRGVS